MRIDGLLQQLQIMNTNNILDLLKNLDTGDTVRVQVVEASGRELVLKLPDGRLFNAATLVDTGAAKGEVLELQVNNKSDRQIFMEIVKPVQDPSQAALKQLAGMNVTPDSGNIAATGYLNEENLPINKEILQTITQIVSKFKVTPELAAFAAYNAVWPDASDMELLTRLADGTFKLGSELQELIKSVDVLKNPGLSDQAPVAAEAGGSFEAVIKIKNQIEDLFIKLNSPKLAAELASKASSAEMLETLNHLKESAAILRHDGLTLADKLEEVESGVRLMSRLDGQTSYLQLPIEMPGTKTTGELYIMKKRSRRRVFDPENSSLLISLNTENIGLIESLINVDKKNIRLNLHAQKQEIIDFLKENCQYLYQSLNSAGYKLVDIRYKLIKDKTNILNAGSRLRHEFEVRKGFFDFRI